MILIRHRISECILRVRYRLLCWLLDEVPSVSQIKKDAHALFSVLLSACQGGVVSRILMENRNKQDNIRARYQLFNQYDTTGLLELNFLKISLLQYYIKITKQG
jgi:hypothetical protein